MSKGLKVTIIIISIIITLGIVVGILWYTGFFEKEESDRETVFRYETEDGHIYTEAEWSWKPIVYQEVIPYMEDTSNIDRITIALSLDDDTFYDVTIPNKEYIYDYGKTVWAKDGSFTIRVIGDASVDNLSAIAGINNGENINARTLSTKLKIKGSKTVATLVDNYAIVVDVYSNDESYTIIRDSLSSNNKSYKISEFYIDDVLILDKLSYEGRFISQSKFKEINLIQNRYMFENGILWTQSVVKPFYETKNIYLSKLVASSGSLVTEIYDTSKMFYAKAGDYYIGLVYYNSNTTIAFIGCGEEAKCNIISLMLSLQ